MSEFKTFEGKCLGISEISSGFAERSSDMAASIEEQSASMEEILSSVLVLSDMASGLQDLVQRFRI